ncbi:hypothetical protein [Butyrivibrio sp. AE2005]|uniref:hypothetical protein n=1 Tax=Butyrivibrio sp. AE2005 TaxID=1496722 RepID=UPI00047A7519|nr:hypothetical protein [Butyrivibrio sp. AE2005]
MPKVSELTGTPWHVEKLTRNEGDERRHKSHCIYYRKKDSYCKYQYIECRGSRYCKYYKTNEIEGVSVNADAQVKKKETIEKITDAEGKKIYPIGSKVRHQKFGDGFITDISNGHVSIDFENVGEKILGLDICVAKRYLEIIEVAVISEKEKIEVSKVIAVDDTKINHPQSDEKNQDKESKWGWLGKLLSGIFKRRK